MSKLTRLLLVSLAILALLFAVGCGGGSDSANQPAPSDTPEKAKKLIIGSDTAYAPFEWQDTASGKYIGFDMDLMDALMAELGYDYEIRSMTFDGLIPALTAGTIDAVISAMTIKPSRAEMVNFTDPYYKSGLIIAVKADNDTINSFDDLAGKKLAVQIGTTGADKANEVRTADPGTSIVTFDRIPEAFLALKQGSADAVVNDAPVTLYAIEKDAKGDVKVVGEMLSSEYYGIAIPKSKPDLYDEINGALKTLKDNGKFAEIYEEWFGVMPEELLTVTVDEALAAYEE
ncbi:MAG: basic amino acid ABC transporter substrate-binding protein [Desulforudis sp.]|nr:MAG: basic amino acid ABC transporter substrate-binding protein [Desulforudis sp.]